MNLTSKIAAILTGLLISGTALATICTSPATIGGWAGATFFDDNLGGGDCDNDTRWTFVGSSVGGGLTAANFATSGLSLIETKLGGKDVYGLAFNFGTFGNMTPGQSATLDYTVLIKAPNSTNEFWVDYGLDSTCPIPTNDCTVTKTVNGVPLTSLNGATAGPGALSGTLLTVHETFTVGPSGILSGATNIYRLDNRTVPEPMPIALLAIGLAGLGFARRDRKSR